MEGLKGVTLRMHPEIFPFLDMEWMFFKIFMWNKIIKDKGEQAVYECGIFNFDPRIVAIIGRLYFRTSYGQNVLQHSIEMAHIAGMLAEELGADVAIAKAGALVHDIGKALDHEVQGTHIEIGMRILQKFGADEKIITAMKSHHEDYPFESNEGMIIAAADALSAFPEKQCIM